MTTSVNATLEQQTPTTDGFSLPVSLMSSTDKRSSSLPTDDLVDEAEEQFSWTTAIFHRKQMVPSDPDAIATRRSVFDDRDLAPHYWPKKEYENLHRFDPTARWTYREEKALVRKLDWKIMLMAAIGFSALNLDRSNINQANSDSFLQDLGLTTDDFNLGNTVFLLAFLCAELPSQLVSKRVGPDHWIPTQICLWSFVSLSQFWLTSRTSFLVCRALLGALQGGYIPDLILYLSYFYTKTELPMRLALFWMSLNFCGIVASFLAYGTLHMDGVAGAAGWRWLFMIEGILTLLIGFFSFFNMPPSPTQTKTWFRPNGWFTEREEIIIVNRVLRDDPSKGDMHNREGLTFRRLWTAVCDYDLWPIYILGLMFGIPNTPPATYLTLLLTDIGFNTFDTNLLTIPYQALGIVTMFLITLVSEFVNERSIVSMIEDVWTLPFLVALYALPSNPNPWIFFAVVTGLLSYPYTHAIQVAWCSRNAGAVASRTVNASLYNMFVQASGIISAQIYVASEAPRYQRGNMILIIICIVNICILYPGTKAYYIWRNRQRAKIWDAMTTEERVHYLSTTKDVANRRLDFRFAH
ncbi:allantoate permease [Suillus subalutaceus]|uniref:allantoate permease n=1 Tax=Suillus subalutaceus TaxID=48586 RepID=UPI001B885F0D|nr:allantoate permease [Suillus subalutaceus]KAG1859532.1 allantoate permease [Suillus subalutaceus]